MTREQELIREYEAAMSAPLSRRDKDLMLSVLKWADSHPNWHKNSNEKFLDVVRRWNIIVSEHINNKKYDNFLEKIGYNSACYERLDRNFADGLLMFIDWAKDKDFILSPKGMNGVIIFDKLDKILKYCMTVDSPEDFHSCEQIRFTSKVYLQVGIYDYEHKISLFNPNARDITVKIDVTHTVDDLYNLVNKASLYNHGVPIEEMQKDINFKQLYKKYNGGARCQHKFDRELQDGLCVVGNKYAYDIPLSFFGSTSSSSSSGGILDMGRKNLGNSGIGFDDYFGEY